MENYQEAPDTRWDRVFCIGGMAASWAGAGWLAWRILGELEKKHTVEFVSICLLLGLGLYLGFLIWPLSTVRYTLKGDRLILRQALSRREIPLTPETHLHRWRWRWSWDGGAQRDLRVESIQLFPPFWLGRSDEMWVLLCDGKATAIRPTPRLLGEIKARVRQTGAMAG